LFHTHRTKVVPCNQEQDLILVLDSSGSISLPHYRNALQFVANLSTAFTVVPGSRLGFNVFSVKSRTILPINNSLSPEEIRGKITSAPYLKGGTRTDIAVNAALKGLQTSARLGVPRTLVILTDGSSNKPRLTSTASARAKAQGLRMFSIGIGTELNDKELKELAGGDEHRVYKANNWEYLANLLAQTSVALCPPRADK
jgi:uncharacterized protein with von Willebrand factor type A (vWA) domain